MANESAPPEAWQPLVRLARLARRPLEQFLRIQAASGIALVITAAIALAWANSPFAGSYTALWHTPVGVRLGDFVFERTLEWFVNDVLMTIFFFVVGMEIRREVHHGELSEWRRAALPAAAALGGMLVPAGLYLLIAGGPATRSGWGVPMATDIAFAVGILTLLGNRVPAALRVLLLALAVIDDLGAIVVIALFYSSGVQLTGLLVAALGVAGIYALQGLGVRNKAVYIAPAAVVWAGAYASGIHPTIAGVVVGMVTPVRAWLGADGFVRGVRAELDALAHPEALPPAELAATLRSIDRVRREAVSPSERLIEMLHPWVAFIIMPLFALANAGVSLAGVTFEGPSQLVTFGAAVGLVVGKPIGVLLACFLSVKLGLALLPAGITLRQLVVLGLVAGIGFTMALFVAQLAFTEPALLGAAKLGILSASTVAALLGLALGAVLLRTPPVGAAATADEAESSTAK